MDEHEVVRSIRARLLITQPFFGSLSMHLRLEKSSAIETLQTDGSVLRYNEQYLASLPAEEQAGVVAHEVMHCALGHPYRTGARDLQRWNMACDYTINPLLRQAGLSLPKDVLDNPQYHGMYAEQVYSALPDNKQEEEGTGKPSEFEEQESGQGQEPQDGQGKQDQDGAEGQEGQGKPAKQVLTGVGTGDFVPPQDGPQSPQDGPGGVPEDGEGQEGQPTETEPQGQMSETDWQVATEQAVKIAAAAGKLPGGADMIVREIRAPKVDWREELREFFSRIVPADYSWTSPNRRFISGGLYLPGVVNSGVGEIVLGVDTSGSTRWMLGEFAREFAGIIAETRPEKVHVVYWDASVQGSELWTADDDISGLKMRAPGGGGTNAQVMFDWVKKQDIEPMALVCLTDLEFYKPVEPDYPVLWAVPDLCRTAVSPFGTLIRIPKENGN